ncbi:MAG: sensor histidine kinase [Thiotrichales bacterium]|nr:sensor histidine kinase [Thiotrichales bacterium]
MKPSFKMRLTIRTRFYILLLMLTLLPALAYRFAIDLHRMLLENQAIIQQQTVINLSYVLENRTDLWAQQILSGTPTNQLSHLNLDKSVLWIVNEFGQVTYVVGRLSQQPSDLNKDWFARVGYFLIKTLSNVIPFTLPYPYPQSTNPEVALIRQAISGHTFQQYRMYKDNPISLMSATPLKLRGHIIGAIVLEQTMNSLLTDSLKRFYRLIGMGALIFIFVFFGAVLYIASLSKRIARLDYDVRNTFDAHGKVNKLNFPDILPRYYYDEISDLRHHIHDMLSQLSAYERYLKQLPKALRHELHNPMNRLSMSLSLLEQDIDHKQVRYSKHALEQLKQIISSLSEANSIEESLSMQEPEPFYISEMLTHYLENVIALNPDHRFNIQINMPSETQVIGDGFMLEQLMDKLISNAKDFDNGKEPITISATLNAQNEVEILVQNTGKALPQSIEKQIFDGMTSIRETNADNQAHLGLGLYIVKLITDFHNGKAEAFNYLDLGNQPIGVVIKITLPTIKN